MREKRRFTSIASFETAIFAGGYGAGVMFPDSPAYIWFGIAAFFAILGCILWPKEKREEPPDQQTTGAWQGFWGDIFPEETRGLIAVFLFAFGPIVLMLLFVAFAATIFTYIKGLGG